MTKILYYRLTKDQQSDISQYIKEEKLNIAPSDYILDLLTRVSVGNISNLVGFLQANKISRQAFDLTTVHLKEKAIEGEGEVKEIILTGDKLLQGLIYGAKISNILGKRNKQIPFESVEEYVQNLIDPKLIELKTYLVNKEMSSEIEATKKATSDAEIETVKTNFKKKVTES